jgi:hypothetical protein
MMTFKTLFFLALVPCVACSGTVNVGGFDAAPDAPLDAPLDAGTDAPSGPSVFIHLKATTAPVTHLDAWSAQTPKKQTLGIRGLALGTGPNDPNPWVVFDLGSGFIEAPLDDKADTIVATVPASALKNGTYTYAWTYASHVRYQVDATVHALNTAVPGTFDNLQVLSDNTTLDGQVRASGYYSFSFLVGSQTYGPTTGNGGPLPQTTGAGITLSIKGGVASYGFPINLTVAPPAVDMDITLEANTHEDFRWEDDPQAGYAPKILDVTPPSSFETVEQFGPNALSVSIATKK